MKSQTLSPALSTLSISLILTCVLLSLSLAERRHVIELYNKNHQITKSVPPLSDIGQQNLVPNNVHNGLNKNGDNEISVSKESKVKITDQRMKDMKTGVDYVQESDTFTLSRRKPKSLKLHQHHRKSQLSNDQAIEIGNQNGTPNKFRDYSSNAQKHTSGEARVLNVPTGSTQHLNPPKSGRIALESSPNNIIIEAPMYNFIPQEHPHSHSYPHIQYGEYSSIPVPESNAYAHVKFVPEDQKGKVNQGLVRSVAVPPLSSHVGTFMNDHLVDNTALQNIPPPFSPHLMYSEPLPVLPEPLPNPIPVQVPVKHPISHPEFVPFHSPQSSLPFSHSITLPVSPKMIRESPDSAAITEAEIQAEILEHFFNDDFFKGFFDSGPPVPPLIPLSPTPEPLPKPLPEPLPMGHQTPLGYEAPYIYPQKQTLYNVHENVHPVYPANPRPITYHQPLGVRYFDELKTAYSNNVEKKLSADNNGNTTEVPSLLTRDLKQTSFPILVKKKVLGQENLHGKPWGEKTVISYSDPKDPNNFVQVSEMRMTVNRPLNPESASSHITKLIDHLGTGQHHPSHESQPKFDDRK